jgi:hypothetical protein
LTTAKGRGEASTDDDVMFTVPGGARLPGVYPVDPSTPIGVSMRAKVKPLLWGTSSAQNRSLANEVAANRSRVLKPVPPRTSPRKNQGKY